MTSKCYTIVSNYVICQMQILLQKRAFQKESFPGCYDISSAGHIPAGDDYIVSAIREFNNPEGKVQEIEKYDSMIGEVLGRIKGCDFIRILLDYLEVTPKQGN